MACKKAHLLDAANLGSLRRDWYIGTELVSGVRVYIFPKWYFMIRDAWPKDLAMQALKMVLKWRVKNNGANAYKIFLHF